jgi:excisionase family DNA binding protein
MLNQRRIGDTTKRQAADSPGSTEKPATTTPPSGQGAPLLLRVNEVAELLGISERSVWRMQSAGKLPAAVRLAGSIRWRRAEIEAWVDAGCPAINNPR